MKMIMAVVPRKYGDDLLSSLIRTGFTATYAETRGGMLRQSQMTLFIGVQDDQVPTVLDLVRAACLDGAHIHYGFGMLDAAEPQAEDSDTRLMGSGAVVFVWSLDQFALP